jgi:hypothetical protein
VVNSIDDNKHNSSLYEYLNRQNEKIEEACKPPVDAPKIGIFWLHMKDGKVQIFHSNRITLDFGQDYGSFIVDPRGHYFEWEYLKQRNFVPKNSNYEDLPRGRIAYNRDKNQYVVYYGKYIKSVPDIKVVIKSEFNLKSNIKWIPDLHYDKIKRWGF